MARAQRDGKTEGPRRRVDCGDMNIRIGRDGTWFYHGSPITRKPLVCLFASVLTRDEDGGYRLETPSESGRITVEDAPFIAVEMYLAPGRAACDQIVTFRTNVDEMVTLDSAHPLRVGGGSGGDRNGDGDPQGPAPYLRVRDGLEAKLSRAVYYELVAYGAEEEVEGQQWFGIWSAGTFFPLGPAE